MNIMIDIMNHCLFVRLSPSQVLTYIRELCWHLIKYYTPYNYSLQNLGEQGQHAVSWNTIEC